MTKATVPYLRKNLFRIGAAAGIRNWPFDYICWGWGLSRVTKWSNSRESGRKGDWESLLDSLPSWLVSLREDVEETYA
jgi:hypothetical protein